MINNNSKFSLMYRFSSLIFICTFRFVAVFLCAQTLCSVRITPNWPHSFYSKKQLNAVSWLRSASFIESVSYFH